MSHILFQYQPVDPTTWAYLSSLLMIGLFFKFNRFWSVRNVDLLLLILLAPGLLLVTYGRGEQVQAKAVALRETNGNGTAAVTTPGRPDTRDEPMLPKVEPSQPFGAARDATQPTLDGSDNATPQLDKPSPQESAAASGEPASPAKAKSETTPRELRADFEQGRFRERLGFVWLLAVGGIFLVRLLLDPTMVRRPLLEPNLSTGGLIFIGCSLFIFLMANVIASIPTEDDLQGPKAAAQLLTRQPLGETVGDVSQQGPGLAWLSLLPSIPTMSFYGGKRELADSEVIYVVTAKVTAILSHLAIVIAIIAVGYRHFDNIKMGIGAATLYLMLPYTAMMTGHPRHVLPAALMLWAVLCYRRPLVAGMFVGLAMAVVYFPLFLLPLWLSFYWQRGVMRFTLGFLITVTVLALAQALVWTDPAVYWMNVQKMFGLWLPVREGLEGVWGLGWDPVYRIPVLTASIVLSCTMALWPAQKNLGTLLSCSAAVMVATQFWHGHGGGLFMAWYLPLALLTIFRPNLEDRVALTVLGEGWFPRRRAKAATVEKAA